MQDLVLVPGSLSLPLLRRLDAGPSRLAVAAGARAQVDAAAATVARTLAAGDTVYGVNTGFGLLARTRIDELRLAELQRSLVLSHSAGTGAPLDARVVRLVTALKVASLARGYSGVRWSVIERMLAVHNAGIVPCIPGQGSVGASGDLAPLAHYAAVLLGEGQAWLGGELVPGGVALARAGLAPLALAPKEGLALLNGTQVSTALALAGAFALERAFAAALVAGALALDACLGSDTPFDARIHALRAHPGQAGVAAMLRALAEGSAIRASHRLCHRVQDPYSLRCQPQVMGACLDVLCRSTSTLVIEANAVSDNPLVFAADDAILSGGNFHAEPVAFAADALALAVAEAGALSERRIALLMDTALSRLPPFLVRDGGVNSGFMLGQVTAAALASENKSLAHPASVDSLPTSANQEDHVSMATYAARRLAPMAANTARIVAIELLAAAQGVELRAPLATSPLLAEAVALVRRDAAFWERDRALAPEIEAVAGRIERGEFLRFVPALATALDAAGASGAAAGG